MFMTNPFEILVKAFIDSFRPKMLLLTLTSVALAIVFWIVLIWLSINPLVRVAMSMLSSIGFDMTSTHTDFFLLAWFKAILVPMAVFGFLWPIVTSSAVLLAGLYVTPPVVNYLSGKEFSPLERRGDASTWLGLWVTLKAVLIFLIAWIITLPLWLIPGMAFILPIVLTAYLLITVMRFDALSAYATKQEMKLIQSNDSSSAWLIGMVCAFLSFVPPILLIMPVMSALAFVRYYLRTLSKIRNEHLVIEVL
jgi:CysZ protein